MLKEMSILGFRGFGKKININFSLPNGKSGSGLNVIVGPNNSGKTSIIESIRYFNSNNPSISFSEGKRNVKTKGKVFIEYYDEKNKKSEIHSLESGGSQVDFIGDIKENNSPYILPSRRYTDYKMYNFSPDYDRNFYINNALINSRNRSASLEQFEYRIFMWQKNRKKFDEILKKIITDPFDWCIEQNDDNAYYIKMEFADKTIAHTREGIGDGYWSVFTIVDALYDSKIGDLIVIDEPELSLHPTLQKRIMNLFLEYSKDRQIILTTHSPYMVSFESVVNGGQVIRTRKNEEADIEIGYIGEENRSFINSLLNDINNPHTLGLEAKELFFIDDDIIVVEGQEDVVIIPKICNELGIKLNATLFGFGAGGAGKIIHILEMLRRLNYKKVTAIYDGDKESEFNNCLSEFPEYNIKLLFADDIRDKREVNKPSKLGVSTEKGSIKSENIKPFIKLINEVNKYHKIN